jgi:hypothetical protein
MIDLTKPVRRKSNGEPVRILATDLIAPTFFESASPRNILIATSDGWLERKTISDMEQYFENIPEDKFLWLNVYADGPSVCFWKSRKEADMYAIPDRKFLLKLNTNSGETTLEGKF